MDCIRGLFPIVHLSGCIENGVSNGFSSCITCQPFGRIKPKTSELAVKPSREVKTISSLVEKFAYVHNQKDLNKSTSHAHQSISEHQPSFDLPCSSRCEINHEKFTPCDAARNHRTENKDSLASSEFPTDVNTFNIVNKNNFQKPIVAPPRRKRRGVKRLSESSTDTSSLDSILEHELIKNSRNLELSNLDQLDNSRKSVLYSVNYVINNKSNKSGCSNIDVVSNSLESNEMYFRKFGSNSNKSKATYYGSEKVYCENKVYYKNSSFDKYGNYRHGSDLDEVLVCESIVTTDFKKKSVKQPTPPTNSTYTKFYTDSFYQDREDGTSTGSLDVPFEKISQLQVETNAFFRNTLSIFKTKKQRTEGQNNIQLKKDSNLNNFNPSETYGHILKPKLNEMWQNSSENSQNGEKAD